MIYILHISDLHFVKNAATYHTAEILQREAKAKLEGIPQGQKLLIVTGDFHNFNDKDYDKAEEFLKSLVSVMGIDMSRDVFVVPGNHDVGNDEVLKPLLEEVDPDWKKHNKSAVNMIKKGDMDYVAERLRAFRRYSVFVYKLGIYDPTKNFDAPVAVHVRTWNGKQRLNILHLNTALIADGKTKQEQIIDTDTAANPETWKYFDSEHIPAIAIGHNSYFDLKQKYRKELATTFSLRNVGAYLAGDTHRTEHDSERQMIRLVSGSRQGQEIPNLVAARGIADGKDDYSEVGFCWHEWDEDSGRVTVEFRNWTPENLAQTVPEGDRGEYFMRSAIPKKQEIPATEEKLREMTTKCSVCGETISFPAGQYVVQCKYCNHVNSQPKSGPDVHGSKTDQMKYANERRNKGEFTEAESVYRKVLQTCSKEHEARWGLLLCKYGVIYIEGEDRERRMITCRRSQDSIFRAEEDYLTALQQADPAVRAKYEQDAEYIDDVQKCIRTLRPTAEPYDVFLCYKETTQEGGRTEDSEIAQEIYEKLTGKGYHVFYAPKTLKEKAGANYEAVVFLAIESSRSMLVIGTRKEYFESVYVRSEWRRFKERMNHGDGEAKLLLPLFLRKSDLPEEIRPYEGFILTRPYMEDLYMLLPPPKKAQTETNGGSRRRVQQSGSQDEADDPLIMLVTIYLEQGKFTEAKDELSGLLRKEPRNAILWLYQAMIAEEIRREEEFKQLKQYPKDKESFNTAIRFANDELKERLKEYLEVIKHNIERIAKEKVGSYILFGHYPQTADGKRSMPIEWEVLEVEGNKALLISKYGLDVQPYNTEYGAVTWETCTLRNWLNGTFLGKAFTTEEQGAILTTNVVNDSSRGYGNWNTRGGNNIQDKVFLLSYAEANRFFNFTWEDSNNTKSRISPTEYAKKNGAYTNSDKMTVEGASSVWWWLRSPGRIQNFAALVSTDGSLDSTRVNSTRVCVRPALWVNLESGIF